MGFFTVTASWHNEDPVIVNVYIDGELIEATPEHPFFVEGRGWVYAKDLWLGAQVRNADGGVGVVQGVGFVARTQPMWNLSVADAHTFFVGEGGWVVHNASCNLWTSGGSTPSDDKEGARLVGIAKGYLNSLSDDARKTVVAVTEVGGNRSVGIWGGNQKAIDQLGPIVRNAGHNFFVGKGKSPLDHAETAILDNVKKVATIGISRAAGPCGTCLQQAIKKTVKIFSPK